MVKSDSIQRLKLHLVCLPSPFPAAALPLFGRNDQPKETRYGLPASSGVQTPLNLILPIKSWLQLEELHAVLRITENKSTSAADSIGTLHFARFFDFRDNNQMGFFTTYDGAFEDYMHDFLKDIGPLFEVLNKHVVDPAPSPIEKYPEQWIKWATDRNVRVSAFIVPTPIYRFRTSERVPDNQGSGEHRKTIAFTLVMQTESPQHLAAASQLITGLLPKFYAALDAIGTVHSARFVPMGQSALVLILEHDGTLEQFCTDALGQLGPVFDDLLTNVTDPPPDLFKKRRCFHDWVAAHNLESWVFYTGYPTLSVRDILASAKAA